MSPRTLRMLAITSALVSGAVGLAWLAGTAWRTERPPATSHAWIGLPATAADLAQQEARQALLRGLDLGESATLARGCGLPSSEETYLALFAKDELGLLWRVRLNVHGARVRAVVDAARQSLLSDGVAQPPLPARAAWFDRHQLAALSETWRAPVLWDAPQGNPDCYHGRPMLLQACVAGRYAVRDRSCDPAADAAAELLRAAAQRLLPFPPEAVP